jgi:hypothetical protein
MNGSEPRPWRIGIKDTNKSRTARRVKSKDNLSKSINRRN